MLEIEGITILGRLIESLRPLVSRIHVVIGYREELVIDLCARSYRDVVLVRNPAFRSTNSAQSMALGGLACPGKTLYLDGDLLIAAASLRAFVERAARHPILMAIAPTRSENAVCVRARASARADEWLVDGFTREERLDWEWANVFAGPAGIVDGPEQYVFEQLAHHVPITACELDLREVDTAADLDLARAFAKEMRAPPRPARAD
jgi:hypothetical protein